MKTIYILLLLFVIKFAYPQNVEILDSTYYFEVIMDEYELTDKYYVLEREANGDILNAVQLKFYDDIEVWENYYSDTIKYFEGSVKSEFIRKYWDKDINNWVDCEYSQWDQNTDLLDSYKIHRIYGVPQATYGERDVYTYDENGNLIVHVEKNCGEGLNWDTTTVRKYEYDQYYRLKEYVFNSITKWEYLYEENGENNEIFISLINSNQEWDTTWHHELTYSGDSLAEDLVYKYQTNLKYRRDTFIYDLSNNIKYRKWEYWDTINSNWFTEVIIKHHYNSMGQLIEYAAISRWSGDWEFFKELYSYDTNGNRLEYKRQSGDSINVIDEWRFIYDYTVNNNLLNMEYQEYDTTVFGWVESSRQENYWVDFIGGFNIVDKQNGFEIYPNPSNGMFNLKSKYPIPYDITVYDLDGNSVFTESLQRDNLMMDLREIGKGIYFLRINSNDGIKNRKIIIE